MNGFARSASESPRARRNARCGARSRPSTVMREGSFFVLTDDLVNGTAMRQAELGGALRQRRLGRRVDDLLQRWIRVEAHFATRPLSHRVPHLLRADAYAGEEQGAPRTELRRIELRQAAQGEHDLRERDAGE